MDDFEVLGKIKNIESIAISAGIRGVKRLKRLYGEGRWRKLKGLATVRLPGGEVRKAELHWYEAHGLGKKEIKVKYYLPEG